MRRFLYLLLMGTLCLGAWGCHASGSIDDDDDAVSDRVEATDVTER